MAIVPEAGGRPGQTTRGVSGVTLTQFFTAVLRGMGAPVTANNLAKLGAVAATEGHGGSYNPFNYVAAANGSTKFNSAGVQNYPDLQTGINQTIKLLTTNRSAGVKAATANLMSDGAYNGFTSAFSNFYHSWGGPSITTTSQSATAKLNGILDGPPVQNPASVFMHYSAPGAAGNAIAQSGGGFGGTAPPSANPQQTFNNYLSTLPSAQANKIVADLKQSRTLSQLGAYMKTASPEVNAYLKYLSTITTGKAPAAAQQAQQAAIAQSAPVAFTPIAYNYTPPAPAAPAMNAQPERDAFNAYLKTLPPDKQQQVIADLNANRDLPSLGAYMSTAPPEVNRYIHFLATLDPAGQNAEKNMLSAPDPQQWAQTTDLLKKLGVNYNGNVAPTPALLAFLNGLGLNLQTAADAKTAALNRISTATQDSMADIDRTAGRTKQNITADLIRRNILTSGESNTRYARQGEDVAKAQSDVTNAGTTAKANTDDAYTSAASSVRQQALDRILGVEQDQSTAKATAAANEDSYRRQQAAAEAANAASMAAQQAATKAQIDATNQYASQGYAV
jgi:hypothetical protein